MDTQIANPFSFMHCLKDWRVWLEQGIVTFANVKNDKSNDCQKFVEKYKNFNDVVQNRKEWMISEAKNSNLQPLIKSFRERLIEPLSSIKQKYWISSGDQTSFVNSLWRYPIELFNKKSVTLSDREIDVLCLAEQYGSKPKIELWQTGYLSFTGEKEGDLYKLNFPNEEVKSAFKETLLEWRQIFIPDDVVSLLREEDYAKFTEAILKYFKIEREGRIENHDYYKSTLFHMINAYVNNDERAFIEVNVSSDKHPKTFGRPDIIAKIKVNNEDTYIVFELKHYMSDTSGTATERKYLKLVRENIEVKAKRYISVDMIFNYTNLVNIIVHELKEGNEEPIVLFHWDEPKAKKKKITKKFKG